MEKNKMEGDEEEDSVDEKKKKKSSVLAEESIQGCVNADGSKPSPQGEAVTVEGDAPYTNKSSELVIEKPNDVKCVDNLNKEQSNIQVEINTTKPKSHKELEKGPIINDTNNLCTMDNQSHSDDIKLKENESKPDDITNTQDPEQANKNKDKVLVVQQLEETPTTEQNINIDEGNKEQGTSQSNEMKTTATLTPTPHETQSETLTETVVDKQDESLQLPKKSSNQPINKSNVALETSNQICTEITKVTSDLRKATSLKEENIILQTKPDDINETSKGSTSKNVKDLSPQSNAEVTQVKQNSTVQELSKATSKETKKQTAMKEDEKKIPKASKREPKDYFKLDTNQPSQESMKQSPTRQNKGSKNARSPNSTSHVPVDSLTKTSVSNQKSIVTQDISVQKSKRHEKELAGNVIKSSDAPKQVRPAQIDGQKFREQPEPKTKVINQQLSVGIKKPTQEGQKGPVTPRKGKVHTKEVDTGTVKQIVNIKSKELVSQHDSALLKQDGKSSISSMTGPTEVQQSSLHQEGTSQSKTINKASAVKDTSEPKAQHIESNLIKQTPNVKSDHIIPESTKISHTDTDISGNKIKTTPQNKDQNTKKETMTQRFDSKTVKSEQENKVNSVKSSSITKQPKLTKTTKKGYIDTHERLKSENHITEIKSEKGKGILEQKQTDIKKISPKDTERKEQTSNIVKKSDQEKSSEITSENISKESIHNSNNLRDVPTEKKLEEKTYKSEPKKKSEANLHQKPQHTSNKDNTVSMQEKELNKVSTSHTVPGTSRPVPKGMKEMSADEVLTLKDKEKLAISIPKSKPEKTGAQRDISPRKVKDSTQKNIPKQEEKSGKVSKSQTEKKIEIVREPKNYKLTDSNAQTSSLGLKDGSSIPTSGQKTNIVVDSACTIKKKLPEETTVSRIAKLKDESSEPKDSSDVKLPTVSVVSNNEPEETTDNRNIAVNTNTTNISHDKDKFENKEIKKDKYTVNRHSQKEEDHSQIQNSLKTEIVNGKDDTKDQIDLEGQTKVKTYQTIPMHDSQSEPNKLCNTTQAHPNHTGMIFQDKKIEEKFQRSYNNQKLSNDITEPTKPLVQTSDSSTIQNTVANQTAKAKVVTQEPKDKQIKDKTAINIQGTLTSVVNANKTGLPQKEKHLLPMKTKDEQSCKNTVLHQLEGTNDLQQTKQQSEQPQQGQNGEQSEEDNSTSGCGIQGRSCPIYFGVKSYLHHFYDSTPSKNPIFEENIEEDDFEYLVDPNKGRKRGCCKGFWFRAGLWGGVNLLLVGVIALLVGYLTPQREMVIAYHDELEILDRWAITFNRRLELCRLAGLAVFCCGGVVLLVTLLLSTFLHNNSKCCCDDSYHYTTTSMVEPFIGNQDEVSPIVPSSSKIPITEKIKSVQPSIWPEIATVKDGSVVVQMP